MESNTYNAVDRDLFKLCLSLFLSYMTIGIPLPVISLYVHQNLGMSNFYVGLAVGIQFLATLLTRGYAGRQADEIGAKTTTIRGITFCSMAGVMYVLSATVSDIVWIQYALLIIGRLVLGYGESQLLTGNLTWNLGLFGPKMAGKVMSWIGLAIFASLAVGSPVGLLIHEHFGFAAMGGVITLIPLISFFISRRMPGIPVHGGQRLPLKKVLNFILVPGTILALQGVGFAVISTFISLYFHVNDWPNAGFALSLFGIAFILVRIFGSHYLDKFGNITVIRWSLLIEFIGLAIIAFATDPMIAFLGAMFSGCGCSLIFPALGSILVKKVPPQARGTAMGGYAAFQDVAYAITGPCTGLIANSFGYAPVFATGAVCAVIALLTVGLVLD